MAAAAAQAAITNVEQLKASQNNFQLETNATLDTMRKVIESSVQFIHDAKATVMGTPVTTEATGAATSGAATLGAATSGAASVSKDDGSAAWDAWAGALGAAGGAGSGAAGGAVSGVTAPTGGGGGAGGHSEVQELTGRERQAGTTDPSPTATR